MKILVTLIFLMATSAWAKWSVASYNIRNFDRDYQAGNTNVTVLGQTIKTVQSDVMGFIEVVNLNAFAQLIQKNLPGYIIQHSNCGGFGKQKLAIVFNAKTFKFVSQVEDLSFSGSGSNSSCGSLRPMLMVTLQHKATGKFYVFAAVHLKAGGSESAMRQRWSQYELLTRVARKYRSQNLVMLGDFNTTGYNLHDQDYVQFERFLNSSSMRTMSENIGCTSYWTGPQNTGVHQSSVLDHIVVENDMLNQVTGIYHGSHCAKLDCRPATPEELGLHYQTVSDHCPIMVTFR